MRLIQWQYASLGKRVDLIDPAVSSVCDLTQAELLYSILMKHAGHTNSLLPPNVTLLERALEAGGARILDVATPGDIDDPMDVPRIGTAVAGVGFVRRYMGRRLVRTGQARCGGEFDRPASSQRYAPFG